MKDQNWLKSIIDQTSFIPTSKKVNIRQRLWHIDNEIFHIPICPQCEVSQLKWSIIGSKYSTYCSSKCAHNSESVKNKTTKTCLEKYGVKTNLQLDSNKEKQKKTCITKYGVDNFAKSPIFKERLKERCQEKYGVDNTSYLQSVKDKCDSTNFQRYGRKRKSQIHISKEIIDIKNNKELMLHWHHDLKMSIFEIADTLNISHSQLCMHFTNNLKIDIKNHIVSYGEKQIRAYLDELGINYHVSDRNIIKPKELDIVIPKYNIAIEFNGILTHSEIKGYKEPKYHLNKTLKCQEAGYRLLHIFDGEWNKKREIVKSRLSSIFQKNIKIYARKCIVKQISDQDAVSFFEKTHIQGHANAKISYGLYHDNKLVAAMSFGKSRFNKSYEWELIRFSNELFVNVVGGAGKIFNHFLKIHGPNSIVSYCDLRWNTGKLYENLNFIKIKDSGPCYWYTNNYVKLYHRSMYQKHKLPNKLKDFDQSLTEWENMKNHKWDRIWDCGNSIWVWKNNAVDALDIL